MYERELRMRALELAASTSRSIGRTFSDLTEAAAEIIEWVKAGDPKEVPSPLGQDLYGNAWNIYTEYGLGGSQLQGPGLGTAKTPEPPKDPTPPDEPETV